MSDEERRRTLRELVASDGTDIELAMRLVRYLEREGQRPEIPYLSLSPNAYLRDLDPKLLGGPAEAAWFETNFSFPHVTIRDLVLYSKQDLFSLGGIGDKRAERLERIVEAAGLRLDPIPISERPLPRMSLGAVSATFGPIGFTQALIGSFFPFGGIALSSLARTGNDQLAEVSPYLPDYSDPHYDD